MLIGLKGKWLFVLVDRRFRSVKLTDVNRQKLRFFSERFLVIPTKDVACIEPSKLRAAEVEALRNSEIPQVLRLSGTICSCQKRVTKHTTEHSYVYSPKDSAGEKA